MDALTKETEELRKLVRESHEVIQSCREERKRLEDARDQIKNLVEEAAQNSILVKLGQATDIIMDWQKVIETGLEKRFDKLQEGPIKDLEELIKEMIEHYSRIHVEMETEIRINPLMKRR